MLSFLINSSLSILSASAYNLAYSALNSAACRAAYCARKNLYLLISIKVENSVTTPNGIPYLPIIPLSSSTLCLRINMSFPNTLCIS